MRTRKHNGISLVEVLFASTILAVVLIAVAQVLVGGMRLNTRDRVITQAGFFSQEILETIRSACATQTGFNLYTVGASSYDYFKDDNDNIINPRIIYNYTVESVHTTTLGEIDMKRLTVKFFYKNEKPTPPNLIEPDAKKPNKGWITQSSCNLLRPP